MLIPAGVAVPKGVAATVSVLLSVANRALILRLFVTPTNEYELVGPCDTASTRTSRTWQFRLGVMVHTWFEPWPTAMAPDGLIVPLGPLVAVMV